MFNRWIIYQWSIFHSYVKLSEGNPVDDFLCELRIRTCPTLWTFSVRFGFGFLPNPQMEEQFREDPDLIGARKKPNNHHSATWSSSGFFCEFCHWLVRNQITNQVTLQIVYSNDLEEPDYVIDSILQHLGLADTNCDINDFNFPSDGAANPSLSSHRKPDQTGRLGTMLSLTTSEHTWSATKIFLRWRMMLVDISIFCVWDSPRHRVWFVNLWMCWVIFRLASLDCQLGRCCFVFFQP